MMNLDEAIQHCEEKAKELRTEAEQLRDIGDAISNSKQPYNGPVKNCREYAEEHEQLAEWLMELKKLREENVNQFLNSKNIILALIEENKALRKQRPQGEWIPVSEGLPRRNGVYYVTRIIDGTRLIDACYFDGQNTWHSDNRVNHGRPYLNDVIAWQPQPEPYMKGGADNG